MQHVGDLQNAWMFDHVKNVDGWTTMACHVYDPVYCKVLTIVVCGMKTLKFNNLCGQSLMKRCWNTSFQNLISRDLWLIVHKPIGIWSELFMVQGTPLSRWLIRSALVYSIELNHLINTLNNLLDLSCKMNTRLFATNTRMPHPFALQEITIYLTGKLNQELVILTFSQFDHLVTLHKSTWTPPTWLTIKWFI